MTNLVFLEAATQSEGAATIIESNEALINFATAEVDSLVEEQALHTAWNVGEFIEASFDITYEGMTDPISDIVIEATSIFADVIASDDYSDAEKKELIEGYAHIIAMDDLEFIAEVARTSAGIDNSGGIGDLSNSGGLASAAAGKIAAAKGAVDGKLGDMSQNAATGAAAAGGAVAGGAAGASAGAAVGAFAKLFSKERKAWKALVKQEKDLRKKGGAAAAIKKIEQAKLKARDAYKKARSAAVKKGAKIGGAIGAVGGGVAGGMYGHAKGAA